jgi:hypothetical protein
MFSSDVSIITTTFMIVLVIIVIAFFSEITIMNLKMLDRDFQQFLLFILLLILVANMRIFMESVVRTCFEQLSSCLDI